MLEISELQHKTPEELTKIIVTLSENLQSQIDLKHIELQKNKHSLIYSTNKFTY